MQDKQLTNRWQRSDLWKGLAAGLVGGLIASWTMNRFQDVWSKLAKGIEAWPDYDFQNVWCEFSEGLKESSDPQASKPSPTPVVQDDTTVRAASAVSEALSTHVYALSSHFVYGLTAEVVRRAIRKAM